MKSELEIHVAYNVSETEINEIANSRVHEQTYDHQFTDQSYIATWPK